jgi:fructose-specific phosphotransferase system IIA component
MKIMDLLSEGAVVLDLKALDKESAINEIVAMLVKQQKIKTSIEAVDTLMQREKLGSTGIGQGVAIPHCRCDIVKEQVAVLAISKGGVEFNSLDGSPVNIIFLLIGPADAAGEHLQTMAKISRILKDKILREALLAAGTSKDVMAIIAKADA